MIDFAAAWQFRREVVLLAGVKNVMNVVGDSYRVPPTRVTASGTDGAIFNFGVKDQF